MITKLIEWCIRNRLMVLILCAVLVGAGMWSVYSIKVDAIPDLSDVQVIVEVDYPGQAPQIVEDQVTYPLTTAMLQVPHARTVRGFSMFGSSFVYIIFDDGTDLYWARSRVLEQLSAVQGRLPDGVSARLGPDATGVGWIFQYVLTTGPYCADHPNGVWVDPANPHDLSPAQTQQHTVHQRVFPGRDVCPIDGKPLVQPDVDLADLRSLQDWYLRYELTALHGVSEVATIGGFVKQYQVVVDPIKLLGYDIPISAVKEAIQRSNIDVGGRVMELSETEYVVRGLGYLGTLSEEEIALAEAHGTRIEELRTERVLEELRKIAIDVRDGGAPLYLADVADVRVGPEIRRGVMEWNGVGEAVGGIVIMRYGENARTTIDLVRDRLAELQSTLAPGVAIEVGYDRADLIDRAVSTLRHTLFVEITVVALVCILFLLHARSELVAVFVVPTGVLASILIMHLWGINANIMSLGGIAIAIGVMVDSSIVMVENAHKHLDREEERLHRLQRAGQQAVPRPRTRIIAEAAAEVGPSLFFSLLIITVSFLPVFVLGEQNGRMFKPLAFTKTFAMAAASLLAVTVIPVLMSLFITPRVLPKRWGWRRNLAITLALMVIPAALLTIAPLGRLEAYRTGIVIGWAILMGMLLIPQKIIHEDVNPISRFLKAVYHPLFVFAMRYKWGLLIGVLLLGVATIWPATRIGQEFMPPLEEGDLLYMPTTDPGISIAKATELLQQTDRLIKQFPEVQSVFGKIGRAETATDPAPLSMLETTIMLKRDPSAWRQVPIERFYDGWPAWAAWLPRKIWPDRRPITVDELVYGYHLPNPAGGEPIVVPGLNDAVRIPGLTNSWTQPIRTRIDMLSTGIRTPVGVKVMGDDLSVLARLANEISQALQTDPRTAGHTTSAFAEKTVGGSYLDIDINRNEIARYGLRVADVQDVIETALGGMNVTETVEGLQRYPVNIRYPHELRDNVAALRQVLVPTPSGAHIPLGQLAELRITQGPPMIKSENARRTTWVFVDIAGIDVGTYVRRAKEVVGDHVELPAGYSIVWSGQYEYMERSRQDLLVSGSLAGVAIVMLLYLATRSWLRVGIVLLAVPFSLIGAIWLIYLMDFNYSWAVYIGLIALLGLDAETGLIMLLYLDNSFERFQREGRMRSPDDLWWAVHDGAVQRIRPKTMTVATTFFGLVPLLFATGAGADTMRRLAAPMVGGLASSFLLELLIYPILFYLFKRVAMRGRWGSSGEGSNAEGAEVGAERAT